MPQFRHKDVKVNFCWHPTSGRVSDTLHWTMQTQQNEETMADLTIQGFDYVQNHFQGAGAGTGGLQFVRHA